MEVAEWLRQIGLERYAELFAQHGISADVLPHLTAEDLKDAGIASVGDRRRLLVAIRALRGTVAGTPPHASELGASAERRQITALFCDIVDSTALTTRLDPEELRELLSRYQLNVNAAVAATGGYVARVVGDAVLVYFGWPNADEAHAESAVRAGLAIIDTIDTHHLSVRVGIASGLVVIGDLMGAGAVQEQMAVGQTLHLAARLQSLAQSNTILVNEATHDQVRLLFETEDLGPVTLKGFSAAQQVWRVHRPTTLSGRSEALFATAPTPLVGRTNELDFLLDQWRRTLSGDGRVVLIAGEPGIGKSRLLAALEERLADQRHFSLRYFCSPYHQDDVLYPIISRWERELGFSRNDSADDKLRKLESLVASRGLAPEGLPLLSAMLSIPLGDRYPSLDLSAQRRKEKTFDVLIKRLADLAEMRPVLALFEDAHWADPTTLELVGAGIDRLADLPVFRIVSFRPEFVPPWIGRPNVTVLTLGRLDRGHSELLAKQVAAQHALPPVLCERVIQQTDGVPLFIEEMTKAVLEAARSNTGSADAIVVPKTLQGSLMARLDRLPRAKEVAQIGAVIGRNFSYALLTAIANLPERQLAQGLQELVAAGLVFQRDVGMDALYTFKHALVRDVAYESLPRHRRSEIHGLIASVAESDGSVGVIAPSRLGYHCAQAGLIAKAAGYYRAAGERSAERAGLAETRNHLERGLQFACSLPEGPDQQVLEAELLIALGRLLIAIKGQSDPDACDMFERAVAVCRRLKQPDLLARALFARGAIAMSRSELRTVEAIAADLLHLAHTTGSHAIRIAAEVRRGILRFHQGQLGAAKDSLVRALDLCRNDDNAILDLAITSSPDVAAAAYLANTLAHLGYPESAIAHARFAVERARSLGVASLAYAMALSTSARAYQTIDDEAGCRECTENLLAIAGENGFPQYLALGECLLGWLTARRGDVANGLGTISQARRTLDALGWQREAAYVNVLLADVLTWAGQWPEAKCLLEETLRTSARSGVAAFDASLHVRKAIVLQSMSDHAAAEHEFTQAITIARGQAAKLLELQACNGLARLMLQQERRAEALKVVEPVYAWFSVAKEFADLKNASEILRCCSG
jgi:class 3 adenylate cyclase/tetratricopeptide (TPR) repeat protein